MTPIRLEFQLDNQGKIIGDAAQLGAMIGTSISAGMAPAVTSLDQILEKIRSFGSASTGAFVSLTGQFSGMVTALGAINGQMQQFISLMGQARSAGGGRGGIVDDLASLTSFDRNDALRRLQQQQRARDLTLANQTENDLSRAKSTGVAGSSDTGAEAIAANIEAMAKRAAAAEEAAQAALEEEQERHAAFVSALKSAADRRRELSDAASDYSADEVGRSRRTEAAANRYAGPKDGLEENVDALVASIQRAAELEDAARAKAGEEKLESIKYWANRLANEEKQATERRAVELASQQTAQNLAATRGEGGVVTAPFRQTSSSLDAQGNVLSQTFARQAGLFRNAETRSIDPSGQMTRQIQEMTSLASRFWVTMAGDGGKVSQGINVALSPLRLLEGGINRIDSAWRNVGNTMIRVSAMFYSFERIGRLLEGAFVGPYERIIKASEEGVKFQQAISGTVGGPANAKAIDDQVIGLSRNSALTLAELRQTAETLSNVTALAPKFALAGPGGAASQIGQLSDIETRIAIGNPQAQQEQIVKAIDSALLGNLRGLRVVARIDPADLVALSGRSQKELMGDQGLLLDTIQRAIRLRVPDSTVAERASLPSVQWQKFTEQFEIALQRIGNDSGLFGEVSGRFHSMMMELASYVDSPEFRVHAKAIGDDLAVILNNVATAGGKFLQAMSGASSSANTPDKVAEQIEFMVHGIAQASFNIIPAAQGVGTALNSIASFIQSFLSKLFASVETVEELAERAKINSSSEGWGTAHDQSTANARDQALIAKLNAAMGEPVAHQEQDETLFGGWGAYRGGVPVMKSVVEDHAVSGAHVSVADFQAIQEAVKGRTLRETVPGQPEAEFVASQQVDAIIRKMLIERDLPVQSDFGRGLFSGGAGLSSSGGSAGSGGPRWTRAAETASAYSLSDQRYAGLGVGDDAGQLGRIQGVADRIGSGSDKIEEKLDKLNKVFEDGQQQLDSIFQKFRIAPSDAPGDFFVKAKEWENARVAQLTHEIAAITEEQRGVEQDEGRWAILGGRIRDLQADIDAVVAGGDSALAKAKDGLVKMAGRFTADVTETSKGEDPIVRAWIIDQARNGQTSFQGRIGNFTGLSGSALGSDAIPEHLQPRDLQTTIAAHVAAIAQQGQLDRSPQVSSLFGGPGIQNQQLDYFRGTALPAAQKQFQNARGDLEIQRAGVEVQKVQAQIDQLSVSTNLALQGFVQFGNGAQTAMTNTLGKGIENLITRTGTLKDLLRSFAQQIVSDFSKMASNTFMNSLFGDPAKGGGIGNIFGNLIGGTGSAASSGLIGALFQPAPVTNTPSSFNENFSAAANGAVWAGGFTAFDGGGVVNKPTLGLVGERRDRMSEAVIPMPGGKVPIGIGPGGAYAMLPGGRRIPAAVAFAEGGVAAGGLGLSDRGYSGGGHSGGGESSSGGIELHTFVVNSIEEAHQRGYKAAAHQVLVEVYKQAGPGGNIRRMLGKPT